MPALKSPSVIVLDNASYHNIKTEETVVPNFNQRKAVLQDYLSKHNIQPPINKFFHILQTKSCIVFCNKPFNLCPNKFYGVQFAMANRGS
jgi:hypothetical protein